MDINKSDNISIKHGFDAMLHFLKNYHHISGSKDLTDILSGCQSLGDNGPLDSSFWDYWIEAVDKVKRGEPLYKNNF